MFKWYWNEQLAVMLRLISKVVFPNYLDVILDVTKTH